MDTGCIAALIAPFLPCPLTTAQLEMVRAYLELLLRWNQRMNLTAVRQPEEIVARHFGESFFAASRLFSANEDREEALIDIGSGAGFPGLPARIYSPIALTLIESNQRKAVFLRETVRTLGLNSVEVFSGRAADYQRPASVGGVTVTMRAVERFESILPVAAGIAFGGNSLSAGAEGAGHPPSLNRLALLIGSGQVQQARQLTPGVRWQEAISIPRSRTRVLLIGSWPPSSTGFPQNYSS